MCLFGCVGCFPGNESNGCEILCPAVNNAVCKKCEQGNLEKTIVAQGKGGCGNGMGCALFCFKVATSLHKHVLSCIFAFLGGKWGQFS